MPREPVRRRDEKPGGPQTSRNAPLEQLRSLLSRSKPVCREMTEDRILSVVALRRARAEALGEGLFSDPAWDILLELYAAELGGREMLVSNLAAAIDERQSTTARWIVALEQKGLVLTADRAIGLDMSAALTAKARSALKSLTDHWICGFLSI